MIRTFLSALFKLPTENNMTTTDKLNNLVDVVKKYLKDGNVDVPFFIAGGSVYSVMNDNTAFNDIDIFFYKIEDFMAVREWVVRDRIPHETVNALTVMNKYTGNVAFQFIKLHIGSIEDVFNTFDISCSKRAITSDYEIVIDPTSENFAVDRRNINGGIISRYNKYTQSKKAVDVDYKVFKEIVGFLIENHTTKFDAGYIDLPEMTGLEILTQTTTDPVKHPANMQLVHDIIAGQQPDTRLKIFSKLPKLLDIKLEKCCDEYKLCEILYRIKYKAFQKIEMSDEDKRVKLKYAEYFI